MNDTASDLLLQKMERLVAELRPKLKPSSPLDEPFELTDAIQSADGLSGAPLPIPDSVVRELLRAHLESAGDEIMLRFEDAIDQMDAGLRLALEDHLSLTRRQMRESLRTVLNEVTRIP